MDQPTFLPSDNERVPRAEVPFRCNLKMQIRFSDIDILGHVNNNALMAMFDLAKIDYFTRISGGRSGLSEVKAAVVNINCDLYHPVYFTDDFRIYTTISKVGSRSFTIEQRGIDAGTGDTRCRCVTVLAGFDPATASPIEVEASLVAMAESYEKRRMR